MRRGKQLPLADALAMMPTRRGGSSRWVTEDVPDLLRSLGKGLTALGQSDDRIIADLIVLSICVRLRYSEHATNEKTGRSQTMSGALFLVVLPGAVVRSENLYENDAFFVTELSHEASLRLGWGVGWTRVQLWYHYISQLPV